MRKQNDSCRTPEASTSGSPSAVSGERFSDFVLDDRILVMLPANASMVDQCTPKGKASLLLHSFREIDEPVWRHDDKGMTVCFIHGSQMAQAVTAQMSAGGSSKFRVGKSYRCAACSLASHS